MSDATWLTYEVSDADVDVFDGDTAILHLDTDKARVALSMSRTVLVRLVERSTLALRGSKKPSAKR
ncbi:MAG: hypothetical protein KGQ82_12145 [Alphaproteobacteria bacterium]|nr:hypothetical protein [Alphaproteobacteria bacterium]